MKRLDRCSVCDAVSSPEIATNQGDYTPMKFFVDPRDPNAKICSSCYNEIEEANSEWFDETAKEEMGNLDDTLATDADDLWDRSVDGDYPEDDYHE